jgi:hypothetical protein
MATQTRCLAATSPAGPDKPKSLPGTVRTQLPSAAFTSVTELYLTSDHPALLATVSREDLLSWIQAE